MSTKMFLLASIFLLVTFITCSKAQNTFQCIPTSCGDIPEIKFPFRLRAAPQHCGELGYELDCQNNQTVFNYKSRIFNVQDINYKSYSIRLLDPGLKEQQENCTVLPNHSARYNTMTSLIFSWLPVDNEINYVNCLAPINSPRYMPTSFCSKNEKAPASNFTYLVIGEILQDSDLADGCRVGTVAWSAAPGISPNKSSLSSTHQALSYGFELSWRHSFLCRECETTRYRSTCILEENSDTATCRTYCSEDFTLSELPFRCTIEYYSVFVFAYGIIGLGGLLAIRFLLGISILIAIVVWQCKRRNFHTSNEQNC